MVPAVRMLGGQIAALPIAIIPAVIATELLMLAIVGKLVGVLDIVATLIVAIQPQFVLEFLTATDAAVFVGAQNTVVIPIVAIQPQFVLEFLMATDAAVFVGAQKIVALLIATTPVIIVQDHIREIADKSALALKSVFPLPPSPFLLLSPLFPRAILPL